MVKNKTGGNKSKNIGSKFSRKIVNVPKPDFENSFFGEVTTKPNGLIANVKILPIPQHKQSKITYNFDDEFLKGPIQVNIGKLKGDRRNNFLVAGDIVQVEINFEMKRKNGATFAYLLCKYTPLEVREFKKEGLIKKDDSKDEDDPFLGVDEKSSDESEGTTTLDDL